MYHLISKELCSPNLNPKGLSFHTFFENPNFKNANAFESHHYVKTWHPQLEHFTNNI
jgi:hypothetical protein